MPTRQPNKPSPRPSARDMRLQKALSLAGVCSRRDAEKLITSGRVSVNGEVVLVLGTKVSRDDLIRVDQQSVEWKESFHYILLHKPPGVLCTLSDPEGRPKVVDLVPAGFGRLYPVGRLDWSAQGVLLLTDDGDLAWRMTHPRFGVKRVYAVKVDGIISPDDPRLGRILSGVTLDDGDRVRAQAMHFISRTARNSWIEMTLGEGKNREVRRICDAVGLSVLKLVRIAYGPLTLEGLKPGQWRELSPAEVRLLKAGIEPSTRQDGQDGKLLKPARPRRAARTRGPSAGVNRQDGQAEKPRKPARPRRAARARRPSASVNRGGGKRGGSA